MELTLTWRLVNDEARKANSSRMDRSLPNEGGYLYHCFKYNQVVFQRKRFVIFLLAFHSHWNISEMH